MLLTCDHWAERTNDETENHLMREVSCNENSGNANTYLNDPESCPQNGLQEMKPAEKKKLDVLI